jgi:hypothetical protein
MAIGGEKKRRASVPETVGAWLRLWTPPRDVEVPPAPPPRTLAIAGVLALLLLAGAAALIVPAIDSSKDRAAAREARAAAERRAESRREQIAEQRPRRLDLSELRPSSGAPQEQRLAARSTLLERAETAISADARERAAAGELEGRPRGTECEPYPTRSDRADWPDRDLGAARGVYNCLVFVRAIAATETNGGGQLGYPFRAVLDFERFTATWCKTNPVPGERVVPDPRTVIELPRACRAS